MRRVTRVVLTAVPPLGGAAVFCWPYGRWGLLLVLFATVQWLVWLRVDRDRLRWCVAVSGLWLAAATAAWSGLCPRWVPVGLLLLFAAAFWAVVWWPGTLTDTDGSGGFRRPRGRVSGVWLWLAVAVPLAWWVGVDTAQSDEWRASAVVAAAMVTAAASASLTTPSVVAAAAATAGTVAVHAPALVGAPFTVSRQTAAAGWCVAAAAWWAVLAWPAVNAWWRHRGDPQPAPAPEPPTGPLRVPYPYVAVPLGVDRVRPEPDPVLGVADALLEVWPDGAPALHLDEVGALLRMSGSSTRDVRDTLTEEGVTVTDRVGRRRDGRSITKPGVRVEHVREASQHHNSPSRDVTTP